MPCAGAARPRPRERLISARPRVQPDQKGSCAASKRMQSAAAFSCCVQLLVRWCPHVMWCMNLCVLISRAFCPKVTWFTTVFINSSEICMQEPRRYSKKILLCVRLYFTTLRRVPIKKDLAKKTVFPSLGCDFFSSQTDTQICKWPVRSFFWFAAVLLCIRIWEFCFFWLIDR